MIVDALSRLSRYDGVHPRLREAIAALPPKPWTQLVAGRCELGPDGLYANVDHGIAVGRERAVLEAHRRYVDVQITIAGDECIGWLPLEECRSPREPFHEDRDIGFFLDTPRLWAPVPPGHFAIFFPEDAHAPLAGAGPLRKIIVKLPV